MAALPKRTFDSADWLYEDVCLHGLEQPGQELAPVELYRSEVRGARLGGATLRRWVFEDCKLVDCDLSNANLVGCAFQRVTFVGCRLVGVDWRVVEPLLLQVGFEECTLSLSNFAGVPLRSTRLTDCSATEVDFTRADLRSSIWHGTRLDGALFAATRLEGADLSEAVHGDIDPASNKVAGAVFSVEAALRFVRSFGIVVR
jgi:fluoroquinolone resistance protein